MRGGQEGFRAPEGSQGQRTPVFDTIETALYKVTRLVEQFGVAILCLAVFTGRYAGLYLAFSQPVAQVIRVVPPIGDDCCAFANNRLKALFGMRYIGLVASRKRDAQRPATSVTNQMQLAVQPALCMADCPPVTGVFFTPLAAIRWVLTWVASIIRVWKSAFSCASVSNIRSKTPAVDQRL